MPRPKNDYDPDYKHAVLLRVSQIAVDADERHS
jgi:hypothetical protein